MTLGLQIAATGFVVVCAMLVYCRVADDVNIEEPEWLRVVLGLTLIVSAFAVPVGLLKAVWA